MHINSDGHSRGLITAWSPKLNEISVANFEMVLKTVLEDRATGVTFSLLNVYGSFFSSGLLKMRNMVMGGDKNLFLLEMDIGDPHPKRML